jgi:hypothetical protein
LSEETEVVYRGVRWRRASSHVSWYNQGLGKWVEWGPGTDAPPLPAGWAHPRDGGAGDSPTGQRRGERQNAMATRASMRSPYRIVPIFIALSIVAVAVWQATRPPRHASSGDIAAAQALKGQCLAQIGDRKGSPAYSPVPVPCGQRDAAVRVIAVLVPGRRGSCPRASTVVQMIQPDVVGEPSECVVPVKR